MNAATRYAVLRSRDSWVSTSLNDIVNDGSGDLHLSADVTSGVLRVDALDAGELSNWYRVVVEVEIPESTRVIVEVAAHESATTIPVYKIIDNVDFLLPGIMQSTATTEDCWRYLWLRVRLETLSMSISPVIHQVRAQTAGENYLEELPAFYTQDDVETGGFLERFIELIGADFGDIDLTLSDLPQSFDPEMAKADDLAWLGQWLGWVSLPQLPAEQFRKLVGSLHELNQERGTLKGLQKIIQAFMSIEVRIVEHFKSRRVWRLGTHVLDTETGLSRLPDSMMVPDSGTECDDSVHVVGQAVIGEQGALERDHFGTPVFDDDAFRFTVFVPPGAICNEDDRARLRRLIDQEKPAHTDYHLCFIKDMNVGDHLHVGVNTVIGTGHEPIPLGKTRIGLDSYVAESTGTMRIGINDRIGNGQNKENLQ